MNSAGAPEKGCRGETGPTPGLFRRATMPRPTRHGFIDAILVFLLALVPAAFAMAQEGPPPPLPAEIPLNAGVLTDDRLQILIELPDTPAAVVYGSVLESTAGGRDRALAAAKVAAQAQLRTIGAAQQRLTASLSALGVTEIYRVARAYNGIAIAIQPEKLAQLRRLSGIKA